MLSFQGGPHPIILATGYLELNEKNNVTGAVHYFNSSHALGDTDATHNLAVIHTYFKQFDPDPVMISNYLF